jgi:cytidylate kinase
MTYNCIAIGGIPASGKSTLINTIYKDLDVNTNFKSGLIRGHYLKEYNLLIVGIYNTFKKFKGTDLLSMSAQADFKKLIDLNKYNIVFEGDRLFTNDILEYVNKKYKLNAIILKTTNENIEKRHKQRKDKQTEKFLKSRNTKINNILKNPNLKIQTFNNDNFEDMSKLVSMLVAIIKKFK